MGIGRQLTACCKQAVYRVPVFKRLIDSSPADAVFLVANDDLREDPFLLPNVLGYLGLPDPARWAVPEDYKVLLGIVKVARCLGVDEVINHLANTLEIPPAALRTMKTGALLKKIRSQIRCVS